MAKLKDNAKPLLVVAFACALAFLGVWRKDLDVLDAMALVGSAVTVGAGMHAHRKRKAKKAPAPKPPAAGPTGPTNGAAP